MLRVGVYLFPNAGEREVEIGQYTSIGYIISNKLYPTKAENEKYISIFNELFSIQTVKILFFKYKLNSSITDFNFTECGIWMGSFVILRSGTRNRNVIVTLTLFWFFIPCFEPVLGPKKYSLISGYMIYHI